MVGIETAEFLASRGKSVILAEMTNSIADDMEPRTRSYLLYRIRKYPLEILMNEKVVEITPDGVITSNGRWRKKILGIDHIILAVGSDSNRQLETQLKDRGVNLHTIGDCKEVRNAMDAIYEGARLGLTI